MTLQRYALFYMTTSFVWDAMRAVGNGLLILAFGGAILRVLRRFHARFAYTYIPLAPLPLSTPSEKPSEKPIFHSTNRVVAPLEQP
jgi:hypothetical protein